MSTLKSKRSILITAGVLIVLLAISLTLYFTLRPAPETGSKTLTICVVDNNAAEKSYTVHTDAAYLRGAMEETKGLTFSGSESEYGMMVDTINGLRADYTLDGAYWAFYVGEEYCQYGIDSQPVADGESYRIVYTPAEG